MATILFFLLYALQAYAQDSDDFDFSLERLRQFQNFFLIEERDVIHSIVNPTPNPGPPPIPPPPPPPPLPPYPGNGGDPTKLPVVIVNNSGCADSDIWVVVQGQAAPMLPPTPGSGFVSIAPGTGVGTFMMSPGPFQAFSVQLTSLPLKGPRTYAMYLPYIAGRVYLSLKQELMGNGPADWNPSDPNYNTIWDFTEITYTMTVNNLTVNVTAVDSYGLPFFLYLSNNGMNTLSLGLTYARQQVLNTIQNYFPFLDKTSNQTWGHTILQNLSGAITRVLSPGNAMSNPSVAAPFFGDYLNNPALSQGYTWVGDAWNGFFKINPMSLQCLRSSNVYSGTVDNSGRLNLYRSGHAGDPTYLVSIGTMSGGPNDSFSAQIFHGTIPLTDLTKGTNVSVPDRDDLCQMLQAGIQSGYLPTTNLVSQDNLRSAAASLYSPNTNLSQIGQNTGPWSSLYTNVINKLGAIYTFAWSDVLIGPPAGAAISYATFTPNSTYYSIILNDCTGSTGVCP